MCIGLLATLAWTQALEDCGIESPLTVATTEDAANLTTALLECANGNFDVQWVGEVLVAETIRVSDGTSLTITGAGPGAIVDGNSTTQLFVAISGARLHLSDMTLAHGYDWENGGALVVADANVSFSGNTYIVSNYAPEEGGAIRALANSTVSWNGNMTFSSNRCGLVGGAVYATERAAIYWEGNTTFTNNTIDGGNGGAIYARESATVSWTGDGTKFFSNEADIGGAIYLTGSSRLSWDGNGTEFYSNKAIEDGGAIYLTDSSTLFWNGRTTFSSNSAGEDGGALALVENGPFDEPPVIVGATFVKNSAANGGAVYSLSLASGFDFTNVTFQSNLAGSAGAAVAAYATGSTGSTSGTLASFTNCIFLDNASNGTGGAVETSAGSEEFISCDFEGNSAGAGKQTPVRAHSCQVSCPFFAVQGHAFFR